MIGTTEYRGYIARVSPDADAQLLHGEVINTRDVITFQGKSVTELQRAFRDSVDDYLEFCQERGEAPDKPLSGKFVVRIDPELHRAAVAAAALAQKSLNSWILDQIAASVAINRTISDAPEPQIIDLMQAPKASLAKSGKGAAASASRSGPNR